MLSNFQNRVLLKSKVLFLCIGKQRVAIFVWKKRESYIYIYYIYNILYVKIFNTHTHTSLHVYAKNYRKDKSRMNEKVSRNGLEERRMHL